MASDRTELIVLIPEAVQFQINYHLFITLIPIQISASNEPADSAISHDTSSLSTEKKRTDILINFSEALVVCYR